jgi:hypothetical protein
MEKNDHACCEPSQNLNILKSRILHLSLWSSVPFYAGRLNQLINAEATPGVLIPEEYLIDLLSERLSSAISLASGSQHSIWRTYARKALVRFFAAVKIGIAGNQERSL